MQDSLVSPYWYRIACLHPCLRLHVQVRMQHARGQAWYVLHNQATGRHHRVNAQAFELVGRLDGRQSVDEIWQTLLQQQGDAAPTQHDVIRILGQLTDAGLVQAEATPDVRQMVQAEGERRQREHRARLNPLAFRLGLFNPAGLLQVLYPRLAWLLSTPALTLWCLAMLLAGAAAVGHWAEIAHYGALHFMSPGFLGLVWLVYPLMKAVHELGHALMMRRFGCEVPEVGVNFFLCVPMPYVDAGAANRLGSRRQRGLISAAGIMVELALAALGLALWLTLEDGGARQLAFVLMSLGSLSTLLFNGNPLMKFDGYFVATDLLDLPNLAQRSSRISELAWQRWFDRLLGQPVQAPTLAGADVLERWALRLYAPMSWAYRLMVSGLMVHWAAGKSSWLGLGVVVWMLWALLLKPVRRLGGQLAQSPGFEHVRGRALWGGGLACALVLLALAAVPVPSSVVVHGVVWLPQDAQVRAAGDGEVEALLAQSGQMVRAGQPLIRLSEPALLMQKAVLQARIEGAQTQVHAAYGVDSLQTGNAQQDLARDEAAMAQLEAELGRQVLRAHRTGEFVLARQEDLERRQVSRGQLLAYVLSDEPAVVRAVVSQQDVDAVRARLRGASVMLAEQPGVSWPARLRGGAPAALTHLPSPGLGQKVGGPLATDPQDDEGLRPAEPVFALDVVLPQRWHRAGGLARVKLELAPQPLMHSWATRLRQLWLRHFSDVQEAPAQEARG